MGVGGATIFSLRGIGRLCAGLVGAVLVGIVDVGWKQGGPEVDRGIGKIRSRQVRSCPLGVMGVHMAVV